MTIGGVVMVLIGLPLLIFPGGCSLFATFTVIADVLAGRHGEMNLNDTILAISAIGFLVAGAGFLLVRSGLRRRSPPAGG
jgi:hypothetical protein